MKLRRIAFDATRSAAADTWEKRLAKLRAKYLADVIAQAKKLVSKDSFHKNIKATANEITFQSLDDKIYLKLDWTGEAKLSGIVKLGNINTKVFYDVTHMTPKQIAVEWTTEIFDEPL